MVECIKNLTLHRRTPLTLKLPVLSAGQALRASSALTLSDNAPSLQVAAIGRALLGALQDGRMNRVRWLGAQG